MLYGSDGPERAALVELLCDVPGLGAKRGDTILFRPDHPTDPFVLQRTLHPGLFRSLALPGRVVELAGMSLYEAAVASLHVTNSGLSVPSVSRQAS